MQGQSIVSIELAVGAAAFVLTTRLFALIQATRGVPDAHREVLDAAATGDLKALETRARGVRYRNPYGEGASELVQANQREATPEKRAENVLRAAKIAKKRATRRTQQGQAMDLVALAVASGIIAFSGEALPTGPLFWSLAGAIIVLLASSVLARAQLKATVLSHLDRLQNDLVERPQLPSISDGPIPCFWCGAQTTVSTYKICEKSAKESVEVDAAVCSECGKFVATLEQDPESD